MFGSIPLNSTRINNLEKSGAFTDIHKNSSSTHTILNNFKNRKILAKVPKQTNTKYKLSMVIKNIILSHKAFGH